jgi:predicted nucleic acid-binding Zn ribbon protein
MTFNPLDLALIGLEAQSPWQSFHDYRHLLQTWQQVVEEKVVRHARPLYINQKILWVATSSSAWAQTLAFSRPVLIKELGDRLNVPLDHIHFSTAHWSRRQPSQQTHSSATTHPSFIAHSDFVISDVTNSQTISPQAAFERWSANMQSRSRFLSSCPCCQLPTPAGELERWSVCAYCMRQNWKKYSSQENALE